MPFLCCLQLFSSHPSHRCQICFSFLFSHGSVSIMGNLSNETTNIKLCLINLSCEWRLFKWKHGYTDDTTNGRCWLLFTQNAYCEKFHKENSRKKQIKKKNDHKKNLNLTQLSLARNSTTKLIRLTFQFHNTPI